MMIQDVMTQTRKLRYNVVGLTETRRRYPLNAVHDTGKEPFIGSCDIRGVGGVCALLTRIWSKHRLFQTLTTPFRRLRMNEKMWLNANFDNLLRLRSNIKPGRREIEAFYMDLENFCRKDHTIYKVIIGDFNPKIVPRRAPGELHIGTHGLEWNEQGKRLSEFIMTTNTIHGNSQFQEPFSTLDVGVTRWSVS